MDGSRPPDAAVVLDRRGDGLMDVDEVVNYVYRKLEDIYTLEGRGIWMTSRNQALDGRTPIELLQAGEYQPVIDLVDQLASGAMD